MSSTVFPTGSYFKTTTSSAVRQLDDGMDYRPRVGEIVWARDSRFWKIGIVTSALQLFKLPAKMGVDYSVPLYEVSMLEMKKDKKHSWTVGNFVPVFGELKPKDEYITTMVMNAGFIPSNWSENDMMVMCQMEKMRRQIAGWDKGRFVP